MKVKDYCVTFTFSDYHLITFGFRWKIYRTILIWLIKRQTFKNLYTIDEWINYR